VVGPRGGRPGTVQHHLVVGWSGRVGRSRRGVALDSMIARGQRGNARACRERNGPTLKWHPAPAILESDSPLGQCFVVPALEQVGAGEQIGETGASRRLIQPQQEFLAFPEHLLSVRVVAAARQRGTDSQGTIDVAEQLHDLVVLQDRPDPFLERRCQVSQRSSLEFDRADQQRLLGLRKGLVELLQRSVVAIG
jgi:hypothetical protein